MPTKSVKTKNVTLFLAFLGLGVAVSWLVVVFSARLPIPFPLLLGICAAFFLCLALAWIYLRIVFRDRGGISSTMDGLENLYEKLSPGGYCIIDDFHSFSDCERAVNEFRSKNGIEDEILHIDNMAIYWQKSKNVTMAEKATVSREDREEASLQAASARSVA